MKFLHLSDLHIGKRLNEFSLLDDQKEILDEILEIIKIEKPDGVILAGDIYDKSMPSTGAVDLFDDFLVALSKLDNKVFIISGNHDSPERLSFGGRIMENSGVYISPVYSGNATKVTLNDENGELNVYLLPFIKPINIRQIFEGEECSSYEDAVKIAISKMNIDTSKRNILVAHQFVTGAETSESEEMIIGGQENVSASVFEDFDYVALGHIHKPQFVGSKGSIRYAGTPLKYSFSEASHTKSITRVEINKKGELTVSEIPLKLPRDMVEIKGDYDTIMSQNFYKNYNVDRDYFHITLTDEKEILDVIAKLRTRYTNIMKVDFDNSITRSGLNLSVDLEIEKKAPFDVISEFFKKQTDKEISEEQEKIAKGLIEEIWKEE